MGSPPRKITIGDSWRLEYKHTSITTLSCSEAKKQSLERQQHQMKLELHSILKENRNPSARDEIKAQAQVTDLMKSGVAQGLIRKDFTVKSLHMAEPMDGDEITPNIDQSSRASTNVTSKAAANNSADSSFDWGVACAFTCLKLSSPENKKKALGLEQDQLIKEAEELMKANLITAMGTDSKLHQKMQNIIEGGEARGLHVEGNTKVHDKDEVTKNTKASIDDVDLTMEHVDLRALDCSDGVRKALDLQQKELYERVLQTVDESKAHPDYETSIQVGRECDKKLEHITMEGRRRGLVKDPNLAPEDQRMLINKIAKDERVVQSKARDRLINATPDPTVITSPSQHHRELSQLQEILGGSASIRDRPAPALVWRQRGYQAAELEYTDQKDPEEKRYSWRPKDPLILGPKDSTTFKEKRMIHDGKQMLKGTLSGYGGNVFPEAKDRECCSEGGG